MDEERTPDGYASEESFEEAAGRPTYERSAPNRFVRLLVRIGSVVAVAGVASALLPALRVMRVKPADVLRN